MTKADALIDRKAYELAKNYLLSWNIPGVTVSLVKRYFNPHEPCLMRPATKNEIYRRILESAQNANMRAGVIGKAIGGVGRLALVLEGFNPKAVIDKYANWEAILKDIEEKLEPKGKIRKTPRSIWPLYCRSILSAANFIEQFSSESEFFRWVDFFDSDNRARASLPMLLSQEIEGLGFPLSCDFLKEMGYVNFPKPDVHLRDIFTALCLCPDKPSDYQLFKAIVRVAAHAGVSPYNADKVFWLIGSGYFYYDPHIGNQGRVGSRKKEFIEYAKPLLRKPSLKLEGI